MFEFPCSTTKSPWKWCLTGETRDLVRVVARWYYFHYSMRNILVALLSYTCSSVWTSCCDRGPGYPTRTHLWCQQLTFAQTSNFSHFFAQGQCHDLKNIDVKSASKEKFGKPKNSLDVTHHSIPTFYNKVLLCFSFELWRISNLYLTLNNLIITQASVPSSMRPHQLCTVQTQICQGNVPDWQRSELQGQIEERNV